MSKNMIIIGIDLQPQRRYRRMFNAFDLSYLAIVFMRVVFGYCYFLFI